MAAKIELDVSLSCCDSDFCGELWKNEPVVPMDIYTACAIGEYDCVRQLLADGLEICDLGKPNHPGGWTPLMYASYVGHDIIVNLLLDNNVDVNARDIKYGATPLMLAASCGNQSVVGFLLQNGAKINVQDNRGWTALYYATHQDHRDVVKMLIDSKADMELRQVDFELVTDIR